MMGSLGPITGKLVASILSNEKPEIDIAMLSPDATAHESVNATADERR
jgi:hypothetical protein